MVCLTRWSAGPHGYCMFAVADAIWLYVPVKRKGKEREKDLNGQVIEHNIICYGNDMLVCDLFVSCVVYFVVNHYHCIILKLYSGLWSGQVFFLRGYSSALDSFN